MDDMNSTVFPEIPDKNRPDKLLGLTSASYDFPSFAMLNPSLCERMALILYYAHTMDQKKVLNDFYKLCMSGFESKSQSSSSKSSINAWIKNAIVKQHRRRELIISETVSTLQSQFVFAISQVVSDVLCDFLVDVGKEGFISGVNARPKLQCNTRSNYLFPNMEMLLPNATCSNSTSQFICFEEYNKMSNPLHCLRNFWLEFCYHPDLTQNMKFLRFQEESEVSNSTQHSSEHSNARNSKQQSSDYPEGTDSTRQSKDNPEKRSSMLPSSDEATERTHSTQQFTEGTEITNSTIITRNNHIMDIKPNSTQPSTDNPEITVNSSYPKMDSTDSTQQSDDDPESNNPSLLKNRIIGNTNSTLQSDSPETRTNSSYPKMDNTISTQQSDDDQSTLSSESDSDSSGSWSCNDFNDDSISDDDCSYTSYDEVDRCRCNGTEDLLDLTARLYDDSISDDDCYDEVDRCRCNGTDSDDDILNFSLALTEENCLGSPSSRGSLNFVDCSDEEDDYEVIFFDRSSDTGFENDAFLDMTQGFENPCFEDLFTGFPTPSFIEMVNECWNDDMMELQDKPRTPSKVSFAPEPSLVTVKYFEKIDENTFDASLVLDNLRFRKRITELDHLLSPFLTFEHRMVVQKRNCFCGLD